MLFGPELLASLSSTPAIPDQAVTVNTFGWRLILGFPVETAAAQAMPELFTENAPRRTDGRRFW